MKTLHHWHQPTDRTLKSQGASKVSQHKFVDSQGPERILKLFQPSPVFIQFLISHIISVRDLASNVKNIFQSLLYSLYLHTYIEKLWNNVHLTLFVGGSETGNNIYHFLFCRFLNS